jgi:hypothetical protein
MNRRSFLAGAPAGALGLGPFAHLLAAQQDESIAQEISPDVLDFWVNRVGIPASMVVPQGQARRSTSGLSEAGFRGASKPMDVYGSEPLLMYVDEAQGVLVPARELPPAALLPHGDTQAEMQVGRLRLNDDDQSHFDAFASGGLYLDVQQKPATARSAALDLGWSLLGAMLPKKLKGLVPSHGGAGAPGAQGTGALQAIVLPGGVGKTMFNCFLKGEKKSAFASFLAAFSQLGVAAVNNFLPMLQLPGLSSAALTGVRALACKLQGFGGEHRWLFQSSPVDIACTAEAVAGIAGESIRLRSGNYIILPKAHGPALRGSLKGVKMLDGYLVPREARLFDVYEAAPATAAGVSYLSLRVGVKSIRLQGCRVPVATRG